MSYEFKCYGGYWFRKLFQTNTLRTINATNSVKNFTLKKSDLLLNSWKVKCAFSKKELYQATMNFCQMMEDNGQRIFKSIDYSPYKKAIDDLKNNPTGDCNDRYAYILYDLMERHGLELPPEDGFSYHDVYKYIMSYWRDFQFNDSYPVSFLLLYKIANNYRNVSVPQTEFAVEFSNSNDIPMGVISFDYMPQDYSEKLGIYNPEYRLQKRELIKKLSDDSSTFEKFKALWDYVRISGFKSKEYHLYADIMFDSLLDSLDDNYLLSPYAIAGETRIVWLFWFFYFQVFIYMMVTNIE